jgi:hypothetical protein
MRAWESSDNRGVSCVFKRSTDMIEELRLFVENSLPGDTITYETLEMTDEEFEALPEVEE